MHHKDLIIINNEKVSCWDNNFYCDNVDMKSIPESLNKIFNVTFIARKSKIKRKRKINIENIKILSSIFFFLISILKTFKKNKPIYLIISITPYTFFSYLILFCFNKKVFVYLRSNGFEEYKSILGFFGPAIYFIMFKIVTFKSKIITCQERLFDKNNSDIVFPSELDSLWLENTKNSLLDKPRLLYVGRVKIEKGIFSLLKIFEKSSLNAELSIVGKTDQTNFDSSKVKYIGYGYGAVELIRIYDEHNIFILPSFTEAHPKVVDESLSRLKPVIIFEEIVHIINNRKGIFVAKRNEKSLQETIHFIMKNYQRIQQDMLANKLPTKKDFILKMSNILNKN